LRSCLSPLTITSEVKQKERRKKAMFTLRRNLRAIIAHYGLISIPQFWVLTSKTFGP